MEILVDGIIFEYQSHGGISRIYAEILPRICDLNSRVNITILTAGPIKQPLPVHTRIRHVAMPGLQRIIPSRWFLNLQKFVRGILFKFAPVQIKKNTIWHSTYYTLPYRWPGLNVLTVPDMIVELFPAFHDRPIDEQFRRYKRMCVQKSNAVICISQSAADDLYAQYDFIQDIPVHAIPLACSDTFRQLSDVNDYQPPTEKGFILYVGGRQHYKNFDQFLKVYSAWELKAEIDLVVVGEQWSETEMDMIGDLELKLNIHLLNMIADKELCYLYNLALAFVYPSLYEGFGLPLLEAMHCGCPIVASRIPSSVEVSGDCAVYFEPGNFYGFLNALTEAVSLGKNSRQVKAGLERSRFFSWDRCAKMTFDIYADLLSHSLAN